MSKSKLKIKEMLKVSPLLKNNIPFLLRFLTYTGVQFNALIVPLLVFYSTKNMYLVGMSLIIEWIPKLLLYIFGGTIIDRINKENTHKTVEVFRLFVLSCFMFVLLGFNYSPLFIGFLAAIYQGSGAFSNILAEQIITIRYTGEQRKNGHAKMLLADQIACFLILLLAFVLNNLKIVAGITIFLQITCLLLLFFNNNIYETKNNNQIKQIKEILNDFILCCKIINNKNFLLFVVDF